MNIKILYKFIREDGGVTTSLTRPIGLEYVEMFRIIASENKMITQDNQNFYSCIDTFSEIGWQEVDKINTKY